MSPRYAKHESSPQKLKTGEPEVLAVETVAHLKTSTTLQKSKKTSAPPPKEVRLGKDYEVLALLGEGGMGYVYKVKDKRKNQVLAVKVVRPELAADPRALKRFEQEAEAAMGLIHPNLVPVYGQGITGDGAPYLVMEYQAGTPLDKLLKEEKLIEADRAVDIFMQICDALEHAHAKGIVHRDLKPSNIILTATNINADVVRIVDFGIAKVLAAPESRETFELTNTGDLFGSPGYMSPEQCMGYQLDARSDIYSLGCVMYELLSGKPPFNCDNPVQTIVKHLSEAPERLKLTPAGGKSIPEALEDLVLRCLEKDPRNRYQSMEQLRKDLSSIQIGERPVFARSREIAGRQLPVALKLSLVAIINIGCLSLALQQHEQVVKSTADLDAIRSCGETINTEFGDAVESLQGYNLTHNAIFAKRFASLRDRLPGRVESLRRYRQNDPAFVAAVENVQSRLQEGLDVLAEQKAAIPYEASGQSNPAQQALEKRIASQKAAIQVLKDQATDPEYKNDGGENGIKNADPFFGSFVDAASRPPEKSLPVYGSLQKSLQEMNNVADKSLLQNSAATSRNWLIAEILALMALNAALFPRFIKNRTREKKKNIWQNQKQ
ncbi:MAG: serine/threonine protein kinase [Cyanobacteria bacterium SZAS LIN-2]|nr:serine/threonine protein kinase [Cyanobacteria bacterium SZAS LIN-2]